MEKAMDRLMDRYEGQMEGWYGWMRGGIEIEREGWRKVGMDGQVGVQIDEEVGREGGIQSREEQIGG